MCSIIAGREDYDPISVFLDFAVVTNDTQCIDISLVNDFLLENSEVFLLQSAGNNSLVTLRSSTVVINIEDNDRKKNYNYLSAISFIILIALP